MAVRIAYIFAWFLCSHDFPGRMENWQAAMSCQIISTEVEKTGIALTSRINVVKFGTAVKFVEILAPEWNSDRYADDILTIRFSNICVQFIKRSALV